jgi:endonuclease/exonuclease/phosphatase family metal-dependent hydrolase
MVFPSFRIVLLPLLLCVACGLRAAETVRIAEYNVENYLEVSNGARPAKSPEARTAVRETIRALKPDIIALEEIGGTNALLELQGSLKAEGLDLPYWELVNGSDTNVQVALLSRLPITARRPQTNDFFLLAGRRWRVSRGFAEVDIRVNDRFSFTVMAVHLKSKVPMPEADEADLRLEEAKLLRSKIDARLAANPRLRLVVLGDFNDLQDSEPLRTIIGRGSRELLDARPAERNGDRAADASPVFWTEHFVKEDVYSRIDYILLSRSLAAEWDRAETFIPVFPNWEAASDHRPLVATFKVDGR